MKTRLIITALLLISAFTFAQQPQNPEILEYIRQYKDIAMQEMIRTGVPAAIKLAQGIHETQAGKSDLVKRSNNHFGIKCKTTWTGEKVYHDDDARGECFRAYQRSEDSYRDHSDFLRNNQRYGALFTLKPTDYEGWANGLKKAGYATNPRYPAIIIKLVEDYNLQLYTEVALGLAKEPDMILVKNDNPPAPVFIPAKNTVESAPVVKQTTVFRRQPKQWPAGTFTVNDTKVVYAPAGTSLLALAQEHRINLPRLLDFNDMDDKDVLEEGQLVFLQRKRRTGAAEHHLVAEGETLYAIAQEEGIRLENLLELNGLQKHFKPASGEKLYLRTKNPGKVAAYTETTVTAINRNAAPALNKNTVYHTVQQKETLYSIARRYAVSVNELREWNGLAGEGLRIGQQLIIQTPAYAQDTGTR